MQGVPTKYTRFSLFLSKINHGSFRYIKWKGPPNLGLARFHDPIEAGGFYEKISTFFFYFRTAQH